MSEPDSNLTARRAAILRAIVSHYVGSGEPVGSKTIVDRFGLDVSSATVRNEMSSLEDAGYIYQPHTSAGRIPTDQGYRYFVDAWATDVKLPRAEALKVQQFFGEPRWELEDALRQTASLLSQLTHYAAVVFAPVLDQSVVRHVEIVGLSGNRAMVVIVTDTGRVENHQLLLSDDIDEQVLAQATEALNRAAIGSTLHSAGKKIGAALGETPETVRPVVETVGKLLEQERPQDEGERMFLEGTSNIIDEQSFTDIDTVRQVIGALEHRRLLLEVLADALGARDISVRIGTENPIEEMRACTVIAAPYGAEGAALGSLGIVGPTRMDYRRTIAAVYEVASNLGRLLAHSDD